MYVCVSVLSVCVQNAQPPTNRSTQSTNSPRNCTLEARKPKPQSPKTHTTAAATTATTVAKGAPTSNNNNRSSLQSASQSNRVAFTLRYCYVFCSVSSFPASSSSPSDSVPYRGSLRIVVPIFYPIFIHLYIYICIDTFLPDRHTAA